MAMADSVQFRAEVRSLGVLFPTGHTQRKVFGCMVGILRALDNQFCFIQRTSHGEIFWFLYTKHNPIAVSSFDFIHSALIRMSSTEYDPIGSQTRWTTRYGLRAPNVPMQVLVSRFTKSSAGTLSCPLGRDPVLCDCCTEY